MERVMPTTAEMYARLDKGDDAIAAREKSGKPVPDKWLSEWLALLGTYERAVDAERLVAQQAELFNAPRQSWRV
jgi:hypothetical protein